MTRRGILYTIAIIGWLLGAGLMVKAALYPQSAMFVAMAMMFLGLACIASSSGVKHTSSESEEDNHASPDKHTDTPSQPGEQK